MNVPESSVPPLSMPLPFHIALAGPTAAGKTAAALAIAAEHDTEIISVDSALVYRGMDIGTAKPSTAELAQVPHHLIDIRDPLKAYSAAEFVRDATALIHAISARGKLPLLVGGTMLYFKALADGLDDMPAANPVVRAAIEAEALALGWPAMHAQLAAVDPLTAARLAPADSQRIQRALEVFRVSGLPLSHFHSARASAPVAGPASSEASRVAAGALSGASESASAAVASPELSALISLEPSDRAWLHARIAHRFDAMLDGGFLDEVQALRVRGDLHADLPSIRCVGYRQAWAAMDGEFPMSELRERGIAATRQLAKRQITWLRSMPHRTVVACDQPDALEQVLAKVRALLARRGLPGAGAH